ncbi:MAG: hypothetical protein PHR38_03880 [Bacteroidales bacterium]|nr:hypothetical protein [Bacteroidales bacterium]MDD3906819.1 hypothetical protein [Bacteroidales bacterium]MDD4713144.1 hypothetical protein [Bacteroidales bacterium]
MKKLFTVLVICFAFVATSNAQQALGLRFGGGTAFGAEISYQKDLGAANRLEADLGLESSWASLNGTYQWVKDLSSLADGVKWYYGAGAGILIGDIVGLGINGQLGIEYTLKEIPLQFSLDTRPGYYFGDNYGFGFGASLAARYKF